MVERQISPQNVVAQLRPITFCFNHEKDFAKARKRNRLLGGKLLFLKTK